MGNEKSGVEKSDVGNSGIEQNGFENSGIFNYIEYEKPLSSRSSRVPRTLAIAASIVIVLAGIQAANVLVGPMLLALFLAVILLVPLRWLQKQGCPQFLAFLFVLVCTITLFVGITYFVSQSLTEFITKIPAFGDQCAKKYAELEKHLLDYGLVIGEIKENIMPKQKETPEAPTQPNESVMPALRPQEESPSTRDPDEGEGLESDLGDDMLFLDGLPSVPLQDVIDWVKKEPERPLIALEPQSLVRWLARIMLYFRSMLEGGFLVLIFTIFMLFEASYFPSKVERAFGKDGPINIVHFHRIADDIRRYLFLKTLANLMSGSAAMLVYYMFGVPAAFFWGIVAFFMYYIPNIGGTLAAVIPGILILMTHGIIGVLIYAVCLLTLECTIAYGIEPKMLGHGLRLSTLVIILSLFFWGFLLGAIGLFLAAPLTVMIKIILQAFPETRWLAIFLDGGRREKTH